MASWCSILTELTWRCPLQLQCQVRSMSFPDNLSGLGCNYLHIIRLPSETCLHLSWSEKEIHPRPLHEEGKSVNASYPMLFDWIILSCLWSELEAANILVFTILVSLQSSPSLNWLTDASNLRPASCSIWKAVINQCVHLDLFRSSAKCSVLFSLSSREMKCTGRNIRTLPRLSELAKTDWTGIYSTHFLAFVFLGIRLGTDWGIMSMHVASLVWMGCSLLEYEQVKSG